MSTPSSRYHRHRFPPEVISHAIWLYHRFSLSLRDVEELLAERGITVSYETIRRWCLKFGPRYQRALKRREGTLGDVWFVDEAFVSIGDTQFYLWRAVDQDGDVLDILVQERRDRAAAERLFNKVLRGQGTQPIRVVTDGLRSYVPAVRQVLPTQFTIQASTRTIELRARISRLGNESARCNNSSRKGTPNGSLVFTHASAIFFDTVDIS